MLGTVRARAPGPRHIVSARTEHKAVIDPVRQLVREGATVTWLAPGADGRASPQAVAAALRPDTALVSLMHVNNETGVIQDIEGIGAACRARGVPFHVDAAQSAGRLPLDLSRLPVDLLSVSAHKLYGPKGIGALFVRAGLRAPLVPLMFGGGQESGLRPGTLPTHQICGFGLACELAGAALAQEAGQMQRWRDQLWARLESLGGVTINGAQAPRVPHILNVSFAGVDGESLVSALPGIAVATGAACNSAQGEPSYVLRALGRSAREAESALRFSFGRFTTAADIEAAAVAVGVPYGACGRFPRASGPHGQDFPEPAPGVQDGALSPAVRELFATLAGSGCLPRRSPRVRCCAAKPAARPQTPGYGWLYGSVATL